MATQPKSLPGPVSDRDPEGRMTFTQHLGELRTRLLHACAAIAVTFFLAYYFSNPLIELIQAPLMPGEVQYDAEGKPIEDVRNSIKWITLSPLEGFLVKIKVALYGSIVLTSPFLLYQLCGFIFPGLTGRERQVVQSVILGCTVLGLAGAALAYWGVLPIVLVYISQFVPPLVETQFQLSVTINLICKGILGFTIAFQFPMVVLILVYMGVLTPNVLKANRKIAIVVIVVASALLTPPDPISLIMIAIPLVGLFELSIWASYLIVAHKAKALRDSASTGAKKE